MRLALNGWFLNAPATGTGQYLRNLVRELLPLADAAGASLALIAPQPDAAISAPLRVAAPRLAANANLAKVEFEHITYPRVCKRDGYALAHVPHFGPPLFPPIPTVVTIHDLIPLVLPAYRGSLAVRLYTRLARAGARRARVIIADSEASRRDIIKYLHVPAARVRVVYLAAEARFQPVAAAHERARVRAQYNLPERFVLYLGGFDARKNVGALMQAFAALEAERAAGWKLVVAGKLPAAGSAFFPEPRALAQRFRVRDAVQFIGHVAEEDKPALYSSARAFVYPSQYEGFGLPPLEALACGTPVICSHAASLPEVVGAAGILLAPHDGAAWVEALRALLRDDAQWRDLSARGLMQARKFSWARTARETWELYQGEHKSRYFSQ